MGKRVNWRKPVDGLDGLSPSEWLAENYADTFDNKVLTKRLSQVLGQPVTVDALRRKANTLGLLKTEEAREKQYRHLSELYRLPARPPIKKFEDWPKIKADPVVITTDWHIPCHNNRLAERMFTLCQKWKPPIKKHIVGGDLVDFTMISQYVPERDGETGRTEEDNIIDARHILEAMAEWFDKIWLLRGNHENRLYTRALEQELSYETVCRIITFMPDKVTFSKWPWCELNGEWRITHPKAYWQVPGSLARRLAEKHGMNVIMAHGHNMQVSQDVSGRYVCIDSGGMMDPDRTGYYMMHDTAHPVWRPGFLIIANGKVHIFNDLWTDWEAYRRWLDIPVGW